MLQNNSRFQFGAVHLQIENRLDTVYSVQQTYLHTAQSKYAVIKMEQEEETKTTLLLYLLP